MTVDENISGKGKPSFPSDKELQRQQLVAQFYERSVDEYGIDSEQAHAFSRLASAISS